MSNKSQSNLEAQQRSKLLKWHYHVVRYAMSAYEYILSAIKN